MKDVDDPLEKASRILYGFLEGFGHLADDLIWVFSGEFADHPDYSDGYVRRKPLSEVYRNIRVDPGVLESILSRLDETILPTSVLWWGYACIRTMPLETLVFLEFCYKFSIRV